MPRRTKSRHVLTTLVLSVVLLLSPTGAAAAHAAAQPASGSSVWLPSWVMDAAVSTVADNSDLFGTTSLFWYDARSCSAIVGKPGAGDPQVLDALRSRGLAVTASITGSGLGPNAAVDCFSDPTRREQHVDMLVDLVGSLDYDGIDIDYENLALTTLPGTARRVRPAFSAFVTDLCSRLHSLGKSCAITVMPRTSDRLTVWRGKLIPGVYDYRVIGARATRMRVMAYDQHASGTSPGPIAGLPWVRRIASYVSATTDVGNTELGVPTYGRDWTGTTARSLTGQGAVQLAKAHGVVPRFDATQGEMTFTYRTSGERHTVWFSSPRAVAARYALARSRGFAGAAYWAAGLQQAGTWEAVRRR
jgi:spore germination protein YaaH